MRLGGPAARPRRLRPGRRPRRRDRLVDGDHPAGGHPRAGRRALAARLGAGHRRRAGAHLGVGRLAQPVLRLRPHRPDPARDGPALPRRARLGRRAYALGYLAVGILTEIGPRTLQDPIRLETAATHVLVPADGHARAGLRRRAAAPAARRARARPSASRCRPSASASPGTCTTRRSSALHAAHLVLSAVAPGLPRASAPAIDQVLGELRAAGGDMDTSVAELREPLEGRPVDELLRDRAAELQHGTARADRRQRRPAAPGRRSSPRTPTASPPRRSPTPSATPARSGSRCASTTRRAAGSASRDDGAGLPAAARPRQQRPALDAQPRADDRRGARARLRPRRAAAPPSP